MIDQRPDSGESSTRLQLQFKSGRVVAKPPVPFPALFIRVGKSSFRLSVNISQ